jgi:hypothetical protein
MYSLDIELIDKILGIPPDVISDQQKFDLFEQDYIPGTFFISERISQTSFQDESSDYEDWVETEVRLDLNHILKIPNLPLEIKSQINREFYKIQKDVLSILEIQQQSGLTLKEIITHQEYPDIFRKIISLILTENPDTIFDQYRGYKEFGRKLALKIIENWDDKNNLEAYLKASIAAGLIGLNLKSYSAAVSKIFNTGIIPINTNNDLNEVFSDVQEAVKRKILENFEIDFWGEYCNEIALTQKDLYLISFTDDYIETIFQLKFYELLMEYNPRITIHLIPKFDCYGTDISYKEILNLLEESTFFRLREFYNQKRFLISSNGPRMGVVNGNKLSNEVALILQRADIVEVRGARSYESLQGIRKITYFEFAVCREFSEALTGLDAEEGQLVLIRQDPMIKSFDDFNYRNNRFKISQSGRKFGIAKMTSKEYEKAIKSKNYSLIVEKFSDKSNANDWILSNSKRKNETISNFIFNYK